MTYNVVEPVTIESIFGSNEPLTLSAVAEFFRSLKRPLSPRQLLTIARRLIITATDQREYLKYSKANYRRTEVVRTKFAAMWMLGWQEQPSPIHDHADSAGAVRMVKGELSEHLYELLANGLVRLRGTRVWKSPNSIGESTSLIHKVTNATNSRVGSLHLYSPDLDLKKMKIYEEE